MDHQVLTYDEESVDNNLYSYGSFNEDLNNQNNVSL